MSEEPVWSPASIILRVLKPKPLSWQVNLSSHIFKDPVCSDWSLSLSEVLLRAKGCRALGAKHISKMAFGLTCGLRVDLWFG